MVEMLQEQYDDRDNLERLQFLVWDEGKAQFEDYMYDAYKREKGIKK